MTLFSTEGKVTAGIGGTLTSTLTPTVVGSALDREDPSATVIGDPPGISVSFNPPYDIGVPPSITFTMTITVTPAVAPGFYAIRVDDALTRAETDCSGSCVQPVFLLAVEPASDVVESVSLSPSSGSTFSGASADFPVAVTASILGDVYTTTTYAYSISPNVQGISLSFLPSSETGAPPLGSFVLTITATASVPSGVYTIRVGEGLDSGTSCFPILTSPCAGVFTLTVYPPGITIPANLQDGVNVADAATPPVSAPLTDSVRLADAYVAPAAAILSDGVNMVDHYVAPVTATLSDALHLVENYVAPITAALKDAVNLVDQMTASAKAAATIAAIGTVSTVAGLSVVWVRKSRKKR